MNILLDYLPDTVSVGGREYAIHTDFRVCIIFEKVIADNTLTSREKVDEILDLFFAEKIPADRVAAVNAVLDFYRCGMAETRPPQKRPANGNVALKPELIYDYEYDAPYIFGAFLSQYGIDLNEVEHLHWWKFQSLFKSLEPRNRIVEIMGYRATDLSRIENKKERERIARLKRIYALPDNLTTEEKVAKAGAAFGGVFA